MIRLVFLLLILGLFLSNVYGQSTQLNVYQDSKGQILTTFYHYSTATTASSQITLLGSPFLTYPVWQKATVRLDKHSQKLNCELAYNLVTNEVLCRFPGDSAIKTIVPEVFTVDSTEFIRLLNKALGMHYHSYFTILYDGQTKLLTSLTKQIEANYSLPNNGYNSYGKDSDSKGIYKTKTDYYIQKGDASPEFITLTKRSLLAALYEQSEKIAVRLPTKNLTTSDVATALTYYDSLMAADWVNKPSFAANLDSSQLSQPNYTLSKAPLSKDPVFNQTLHHKIRYPGSAWMQGIYGRVYAGFEINQQGYIQNITILSPTNGYASFIESVRKGLERFPVIAPTLSGKYVLPVAFMYTNTEEKAGTHAPVNRLPENHLEGRTLLEEFVVPIVVSKPVTDSKEVWGYFKQ